MTQASEFCTKLGETYRSLNELNIVIENLSRFEQALFADCNSNPQDIYTLGSKVSECYESTATKIRILQTIVDAMITSETEDSLEASLPSNEEVQNLLTTFFKGKIKTKASPIPPNCGCYAHRNKTPSKGHFICYKSGKLKYLLMVVLSFKESVTVAYDPTELQAGTIQLQSNQWNPLPTMIPEKPSSRWEYPKNSMVLALYPRDDELRWTSEFYPAKVIQRPSDLDKNSSDENYVRGYQLDFGENDRDIQLVPEQFVVFYAPDWKKDDGF